MPGQPYRVEVEAVHWPTLLPSLRLLEAFKLAIHPSKLLLAYVLVLVLYLVGVGLDFVWPAVVYPGDFAQHASHSTERYERWVVLMDEEVQRNPQTPRSGVFEAMVQEELAAFRAAVTSALSLDFGFRDFLTGQGLQSGGVMGALGRMVVGIPAWLWDTRPGFLVVYGLIAYALLALFGGAIARLAALHACRDRRAGPMAGLRFATERYVWFLLLPLLPLVVALVIALALLLAGLVFFNAPVLDVIGGALYGPLLLGGFIIAIILLGLLIASHVLYPALAVEGTDAFDAVSRAYNYVVGRPFRFLVYLAVALVYFAIAFFFVSLIIYWTAWTTEAVVGTAAFAEVEDGLTRFDAETPALQAHEETLSATWAALDGPGTIAAGLIRAWISLLMLLLPAFAVSFYFSATTWIYLLLRRAADGVEFEDIYLNDPAPSATPPAEAPTETASVQAAPADTAASTSDEAGPHA